ncbi:MAG: peptidase S24 [Ignavibacteriae bacterium]|nr:MAG: peptidase S24 [Ignavibacteriota bacterium]
MKTKKINSGNFLEIYKASTKSAQELPFIESGVKAGFPSPAEDFIESRIDLNKILVKNPEATFFCRVNGNSMKDIGIYDNDLLVVDKSLEPQNGKVAICFIDGEFTLKRIKIEKDCCWLVPANNDFTPIKVTAENEFIVWGIVTHSIKAY